MGSIPFALSVSHFVNTVGAKAGFAAILGLAILVLLYFAQARETATLRDHAGEASERIRQLEGRINQLVRAAQVQAQQLAQPQAPPSPAAAAPLRQAGPAARVPAGALVGARPGPALAASPPGSFQQPTAPAGVGAPALTAATKLIPTDVPAPVAAAAPPAPAFDEEVAGAGTNGHTVAQGTVQAPPRPTGAGTLLAAAQGTAPPTGGNPPRVQLGAPGGAGQRRPPSVRPFDVADEEPPPSPARRILAGLAALIVLAVVVVVLIKATSGGGSPHAKAAGTPTTNAPTTTTRHKHHGAPAVNPADVNVAVLNGTATANAAKGISDKLTAKGYKPGCVTNALTQTQTATQIAYFDTFRRDALAVAKVLKLPSSDVTPINSSTESISCAPQPPITNSNVVVTIGSDLAVAAGASTTSSSAGQAATGTGTGTAAPPPTGTQPVGTGTNPTSTVG